MIKYRYLHQYDQVGRRTCVTLRHFVNTPLSAKTKKSRPIKFEKHRWKMDMKNCEGSF